MALGRLAFADQVSSPAITPTDKDRAAKAIERTWRSLCGGRFIGLTIDMRPRSYYGKQENETYNVSDEG
jgi:hypothetical protein